MAEEGINNEVIENQYTGQQYIDMIAKIKENSVSKEDYNKLMEDNRRLLDAYVNGQTSVEPTRIEDKPSTDELRKIWMTGEEKSNLQYCQEMLALRDSIIADGGQDPFVANNSQITATQYDYEAAERVADVMKQCIEYARGDSVAFTNELMRRTNDVVLPRR